MKQDPLQIGALLEPAVEALGYQLVGVEYRSGGPGGALLRVYIDSEGGITVEDCERVSYQVSGLLDVNDPIAGHYTLEVSSPGLDRPLFSAAHFARFAGHPARIRLARLIGNRRKLAGVLRGVRDDLVLIEVEGEVVEVPLAEVESARLVPEF